MRLTSSLTLPPAETNEEENIENKECKDNTKITPLVGSIPLINSAVIFWAALVIAVSAHVSGIFIDNITWSTIVQVVGHVFTTSLTTGRTELDEITITALDNDVLHFIGSQTFNVVMERI